MPNLSNFGVELFARKAETDVNRDNRESGYALDMAAPYSVFTYSLRGPLSEYCRFVVHDFLS